MELEGSARLLVGAVRSMSPAVAERTSGELRPVLTRVNKDNVILRIIRRGIFRSGGGRL
ncbi:MAG: hypothetical protein ACRDJY_07750 [Thermoleophilaceae bacterium]